MPNDVCASLLNVLEIMQGSVFSISKGESSGDNTCVRRRGRRLTATSTAACRVSCDEDGKRPTEVTKRARILGLYR